jgi:hypothetical protein
MQLHARGAGAFQKAQNHPGESFFLRGAERKPQGSQARDQICEAFFDSREARFRSGGAVLFRAPRTFAQFDDGAGDPQTVLLSQRNHFAIEMHSFGGDV